VRKARSLRCAGEGGRGWVPALPQHGSPRAAALLTVAGGRHPCAGAVCCGCGGDPAPPVRVALSPHHPAADVASCLACVHLQNPGELWQSCASLNSQRLKCRSSYFLQWLMQFRFLAVLPQLQICMSLYVQVPM